MKIDDEFEHQVRCYRRFQESEYGNKYRFKLLHKIDQLPIPEELYDIVDEATFKTIEPNRLPLFLGSQFGIYPRIHELFIDKNKRLIAVYAKSGLSGLVYGLVFYEHSFPEHPGKKIMEFRNH